MPLLQVKLCFNMKKLIILGASGFGIGILEAAQLSKGYNEEFVIKGFLDPNPHALNNYPNCPSVIGNDDDYLIEEDDVFVCALGNLKVKIKCIERMKERGAKFINLINKRADISPYARIGVGNIFSAYSSIGAGAIVGNYNLFQRNSIISHDCIVGDFNRIDCNVVCVGGVKIENRVTIHTSSVINHRVILKNDSIVGACSFVVKSVKENDLVLGNPAKRIDL